ncbi:hypothetical protein LMIV_2228 [Listeria monocytogenes FSL J1-208]|nr:hypothetical protein LMIV_2228 [Listeria monocytogenes FSL J1-208]
MLVFTSYIPLKQAFHLGGNPAFHHLKLLKKQIYPIRKKSPAKKPEISLFYRPS